MAGLEAILKDTISLISETANFISAQSKSFDPDKIELKSFNKRALITWFPMLIKLQRGC